MSEYFESCARYQDVEPSFSKEFIEWMFAQNGCKPEYLQHDCSFLCMGWEL